MIRDFRPEDTAALNEIHAQQGFGYNMPRLDSPLLLVKKVREVNGRVVAASFLRLTAETYLLVQGSPVEKGRSILEMQPEFLREAYEKGLDDIICVVPPEIAESFDSTIRHIGWNRDRDWPMYSRSLA